MPDITIADEIAAQKGWVRLAEIWRDGWSSRPESDAYRELSICAAATQKILDRLLAVVDIDVDDEPAFQK
jgi:hypothetical protein